MGTSKGNSGPVNGTPILPDWADNSDIIEEGQDNKDEEVQENQEHQKEEDQDNKKGDKDDQDNQKEEKKDSDKSVEINKPTTGDFRTVRRSLTSYLKTPSRGKLRSTVRGYVGASGGSKVMANSAIGGKKSASRFVGFLSDVIQSGTKQAFQKLGIDNLQNLTALSAFTKLVEFLAPSTNLADEPYARSAVSEVLSKMFEKFELEDRDIKELDNITPELALEFTEFYISEYIIDRLMSELGKTLYDKDYSPRVVLEREYEVKDFVREEVKLELSEINFDSRGLSEEDGQKIINEVFQYAYSILEI
ncbi:MAG: hypothetical protein N4A72_22865 [Bacteroidales bacterium]|jgi:hypothetical protein|nr:hypothetical protein [Bacteroidales bacterium]